ncbi:MAG: hypothetical protein CVU05_09085 [Bacteroidetes bacterium HGW-Bacteroidetes-21]|jgi:hypothetical protein|nr:MAG: hypothetical protein CVU05_09085 [Bacteroidetes bacterium HGW-Bacteroidetes-21]
MNKLYLVLFFAGLSLFIYSCDSVDKLFSDKIDEGFIEYDIEYLQDERENPLISLLPTTMEFKFRDNASVQKIEGWMSIFSMSGIADRNNDKSFAMLKIMNEKYVYETTMSGPSFGFDEMTGFQIVYTDCTAVIAGLPCKKAEIRFNNDTIPDFSIFYTDMIKLDNPNIQNPFGEIKGVLLEYQMSFQKIPLRLKAKNVSQEDVLDEDFEIPAGYESVSREKMQEVISNLM